MWSNCVKVICINNIPILIQLQVKLDRAGLWSKSLFLSLKDVWENDKKIDGKGHCEASAIRCKIYLLISGFGSFLEVSLWDSCNVNVQDLTFRGYMDHTRIQR